MRGEQAVGVGIGHALGKVITSHRLAIVAGKVQIHALAETIATASSHSVRNTKKIVRRILDGQADDDAETQALFAGAFTGEDFKEGVAAFLEKRKAVFK